VAAIALRRPQAATTQAGALLLSILVIAVCGLTYELLVSSLSSYLLGNSVYYFSITIGVFMTAMGIGSFLSRFIKRDLLSWFITIEIALALAGGFTALALYTAFAFTLRSYQVVLFADIILLGTLVGLELPLLIRMAQGYGALRESLSNVLSFDYIGALVASILFPLFLLPYLGIQKTSFLVGLLNLSVVFINLWVFQDRLRQLGGLLLGALATLIALLAGLAYSFQVNSFLEQQLYQDEIILTRQSAYQRIIFTQWRDDLRLYLDGAIQFSSLDEYRYHEALVHPAMSLASSREQVLILGGGDGLAAREVIKYADVRTVTLVDLDPEMTELGRNYEPLVRLNGGALADPRIRVVNEDAFRYLETTNDQFGAILIDLPDPRRESLSKLFSVEFYRLVGHHLARGGVVGVQSTSPYFAREAFWSINHTIGAAGLATVPYRIWIPSFGDWGFNLASNLQVDPSRLRLSVPTRYLDANTVPALFRFDPDTAEVAAEPSTLEDQAVLRYYAQAWARWRSH
jgi:spermidine synthase